MDELVFPASSNSCPSQASFSSAGHRQQEHEFVPGRDVLEGWLGDEDWVDEPPSHMGWRPPGNANDHHHLPEAPALKRRGRKPGPRTNTDGHGPALCHVEAERQRRDKLNRLFCELRAVVPTVSRMDKASVLSDATTYIAQLRHRVEQVEAEAAKNAAAAAPSPATAAPSHPLSSSLGEKLEVQMVGVEAARLRLTTTTARHAPARLMLALRSLDLLLQHASVCLVGGMTVQDAVVEVPAAALRDARTLRAALLHRLQRTG